MPESFQIKLTFARRYGTVGIAGRLLKLQKLPEESVLNIPTLGKALLASVSIPEPATSSYLCAIFPSGKREILPRNKLESNNQLRSLLNSTVAHGKESIPRHNFNHLIRPDFPGNTNIPGFYAESQRSAPRFISQSPNRHRVKKYPHNHLQEGDHLGFLVT